RRQEDARTLAQRGPKRLDAGEFDRGHTKGPRQVGPEQGTEHRRPERTAVRRDEHIRLVDDDVLHGTPEARTDASSRNGPGLSRVWLIRDNLSLVGCRPAPGWPLRPRSHPSAGSGDAS